MKSIEEKRVNEKGRFSESNKNVSNTKELFEYLFNFLNKIPFL